MIGRRTFTEADMARRHDSRKKTSTEISKSCCMIWAHPNCPPAMMNSAHLERAKMTGRESAVQADFTDAVMKGCRLNARQSGARRGLTGANLENADLSGCNPDRCQTLTAVILVGAKLDFAHHAMART